MLQKKEKAVSYDAKDIYVLEGLEPVRRRPGMYIGSTGLSGLHHLIWEVVDNSIDEAMADYCDEIWLILHKNNYITVIDNGRGIPVDIHPHTKTSALETVLTTLHAGGKFGGESYKVAGGLHGVGVSVVCGLSKWLKATVKRNGKVYIQEYIKGKKSFSVKMIGSVDKIALRETVEYETKDKNSDFEINEDLLKRIPYFERGTTITFSPDDEIFSEINFSWTKILEHLRQQAYLTRGIKINIADCRRKNQDDQKDDNESNDYLIYSFYFEGGIKSYVDYLNRHEKVLHDRVFYCSKEYEGLLVEAALQYTEDIQSHEISFANNIYTEEGGMHQTGFRAALTRVINDYARKNDYIKKDEPNLTGDDIREGLTSIVSVKLGEPQFEGQTKAKLGNPEARTAVEKIIGETFFEYLEESPQDAKAIIGRSLLAQKAREAARKAKETVIRKGVLEGASLPGKLADCSSRDPKRTELFIVEGDSAGGCFSGDTKIALLNGRNLSFKELIKEDKQGKKNFCYTIQKDGHIGVAPILNPRKTKKKTEVIKIILDNEEEIICTPNHPFMLRNGKYKEAKNLGQKDSLMPLYKKYSKKEKRITINGNETATLEAIKHYNHKIKKIIKVRERIDVYDIEVEGTHNFALASGVFVHNSAKQGRNRDFQAILPLRGKILNVERARLHRILGSKEIKSLIIALGTAIAEEFNLAKLRYDKIVIMTDADVDGAHICTLLLTLFYRYFKPLIEAGHLYIAQPPLYRIKAGKKQVYIYSDEQKDKLIDKYQKEGINKIEIQRYKGLGEMNPSQLWETTMDPDRRQMKQVSIEDAEEADNVFDVLMGEDVAPRKRFIQTHAREVKNLDV